ncbi:MAG: hypothetical protein ABH821_01665, partial [archaeon]
SVTYLFMKATIIVFVLALAVIVFLGCVGMETPTYSTSTCSGFNQELSYANHYFTQETFFIDLQNNSSQTITIVSGSVLGFPLTVEESVPPGKFVTLAADGSFNPGEYETQVIVSYTVLGEQKTITGNCTGSIN